MTRLRNLRATQRWLVLALGLSLAGCAWMRPRDPYRSDDLPEDARLIRVRDREQQRTSFTGRVMRACGPVIEPAVGTQVLLVRKDTNTVLAQDRVDGSGRVEVQARVLEHDDVQVVLQIEGVQWGLRHGIDESYGDELVIACNRPSKTLPAPEYPEPASIPRPASRPSD